MIHYAIADDHKIFRQGLRLVLNDEPDLHCAGEAGSGDDLLQLLKHERVDIALLDLKMPGMNGMDTTKAIRECYPDLKIIILTMHSEEAFVLHLMELGANGYLVKNADASEIVRAVHTVHETNYYFNDLVSTTLLRKIARNRKYNPKQTLHVSLTEREKAVLQLICQEKTAAEIGAELFLSPRTVEGIRATLMEKIEARNIAGLVLYAVRNGLVE